MASRCARARPPRRVSTAPSSCDIESCNRPIPSKLLILGAHRLPFATDLPLLPSPPRDHITPHFLTFSIAHRVRRKRQRLPSSLVIESAVKISAQLRLAASALPMNANDLNAVFRSAADQPPLFCLCVVGNSLAIVADGMLAPQTAETALGFLALYQPRTRNLASN